MILVDEIEVLCAVIMRLEAELKESRQEISLLRLEIKRLQEITNGNDDSLE
jgi:uncharacterized small protein (DUF1192 family)